LTNESLLDKCMVHGLYSSDNNYTKYKVIQKTTTNHMR